MTCPYCDSAVALVTGTDIYSHRPDLSDKRFWACVRFPACDPYVGCHPGTETPLGRLADKELRRWKSAAHAAFDPLWKEKLRRRRVERGPAYRKQYARGSAYRWLAERLGIPVQECHVGMFDIETCKKVVAICTPYCERLRGAA